MVEAISKVGRALGIATVAECVESEAVLDELKRIGVDFAQGISSGAAAADSPTRSVASRLASRRYTVRAWAGLPGRRSVREQLEPPFTVGIEEEYLLVDLDTRDVNENPPPPLLQACTERGGGHINPRVPALTARGQHPRLSLHRRSARGARALARDHRRRWPRDYGLAPIAASTHPFARRRGRCRPRRSSSSRWRARCRRRRGA